MRWMRRVGYQGDEMDEESRVSMRWIDEESRVSMGEMDEESGVSRR